MTSLTPAVEIATVALVRDGQVLLAHRHPARAAYPDRWSLPGGHVEPGETPEEAARRECAEELGVTVGLLARVPADVAAPGLRLHVLVAAQWSGEPSNLAPQEHDELRWCDAAELGRLSFAHPELLPALLMALHAGRGQRSG